MAHATTLLASIDRVILSSRDPTPPSKLVFEVYPADIVVVGDVAFFRAIEDVALQAIADMAEDAPRVYSAYSMTDAHLNGMIRSTDIDIYKASSTVAADVRAIREAVFAGAVSADTVVVARALQHKLSTYAAMSSSMHANILGRALVLYITAIDSLYRLRPLLLSYIHSL
jgi:hypothetical protein